MPDFEVEDGTVVSMVEMLEKHQVKNGFDSQSHPSIEAMETAIRETESEMYVWLTSAGYSSDIANYSATVKQYLSWFVALGTGYRLELAHPGMQSSPRGNSRWQVLRDEYYKLRDGLISGTIALSQIGAEGLVSGQAVITGVSIIDKRVLADNPDAVQPYFSRNIMRHPGRLGPDVVVIEGP